MPEKIEPVHLFISWTRKDELQKQELRNHLSSLVRSGKISVWAGEFSYGVSKNKQVAENLEKAEIFLPLMSADYFNDENCQRELEAALTLYSNGGIRLIPVLNRECDWPAYFQNVDLPPVLPGDGTSLKGRENRDQAYKEIVKTIGQVLEQLRQRTQEEQRTRDQHFSLSQSSLSSSTEQLRSVEEVGTFANAGAFAVIIGVANYPNISRLSDVVLKDARDIRTLLRSSECGYLESNIKLILDHQATAQAIHDGLAWIAEKATPESTAIIYFSGHGLRQVGSQPVHYLLPYNYDPFDVEKTTISGEELTRLLRAIKTERLLAIFDCCHSGGTAEVKGAASSETLDVAGKEFKRGFEDHYLAQLARGAGRVIMTSARSDEYAYILPDMDNSLFTHYLLEALHGKAFTRGDGFIRVFDIFDYVSEKVPARHSSQHPIFKAEMEKNFPIALYQGGQKMDSEQHTSVHQDTDVDKTALREVMTDAFSRAELETLFADIEQALRNDGVRERVSLDVVGGANEGTENTIYKLIEHLDRRKYLGYLVRIVRRKRPGII